MNFIPPTQVKETFFEDNHDCIEIKASDTQIIGDFEEIDEDVDEIWILQCKKGTKIKELENQKIKFPGCVELNGKYQAEAIASTSKKKASFGYANRRHHYAVKNLPISGKIVISETIKEPEVTLPEIDKDTAEGYVPLPESLKIRHPLLGSKFDKFLKIDDDIQKRLNGFVEPTDHSKPRIKTEKLSKKRRHLTDDEHGKTKLAKIIKTEKPDLLDVEEDLKWIKQI